MHLHFYITLLEHYQDRLVLAKDKAEKEILRSGIQHYEKMKRIAQEKSLKLWN